MKEEISYKRAIQSLLALSIYLIFGAAMFTAIERPHHEVYCDKARNEIIDSTMYFLKEMAPNFKEKSSKFMMVSNNTISTISNEHDETDKIDSLDQLASSLTDPELIKDSYILLQFYTKLHRHVQEGCLFQHAEWTFTQTLFYSISLITTIGYGNQSPKSDLCKTLTITYCFIGFCLVASFINSFGGYLKQKSYQLLSVMKVPDKPSIRGAIFMLIFILIFVLLPAICFYIIENKLSEKEWSFTTCLYFVLITLSTIGLGDYIPSIQPTTNNWEDVATSIIYAYLIFVWILFGLVYMKTSMDLLTDSLKYVYFDGKRRSILIKRAGQEAWENDGPHNFHGAISKIFSPFNVLCIRPSVFRPSTSSSRRYSGEKKSVSMLIAAQMSLQGRLNSGNSTEARSEIVQSRVSIRSGRDKPYINIVNDKDFKKRKSRSNSAVN